MPGGILALWNDCDPSVADLYEPWYVGEHLPERVAVPGFEFGRRYEALDAEPRYFTYYRTTAPDVLWSKRYTDRLANPTPMTRRVMAGFSNVNRSVCEAAAYFGTGISGAVVMTCRTDDRDATDPRIPSQKIKDAAERIATWPDIYGVHYWQAIADRSRGETVESRLRPHPDESTGAVLVIELAREPDALRTKSSAVFQALLGTLPPVTVGVYRLLCELRDGAVR